MDQQCRIATIIQDHVGRAFGEVEDAVGVFPIVFQRLALVREDRCATLGDGSGGVVLGAVDVAGGPAHLGAQGLQCLDEHRGLDGHVQAARDAGALEGLLLGEVLADGHETWHLGLGDGDLLAAPLGEGEISDAVLFLGHRAHGGLLRNGKGIRGASPESKPRRFVR